MAAPKKPNTGNATAANIRKGQATMAAKLRTAGWQVFPPEKDPVPDEPGTYLSSDLWRNAAVRAAGPAALGLWSYMIGHRGRTIVDGMAAIPRKVVEESRIGGVADLLIKNDLWSYHHGTDSFVYLHPGSIYTIVGDGGVSLTPHRED